LLTAALEVAVRLSGQVDVEVLVVISQNLFCPGSYSYKNL